MPFNEFALYRAKHYFPDEEHCVLVLGPVQGNFIDRHKKQWAKINVKVIYCEASYLRLRRTLNELLASYKKQGITPIIHLHQPRSGMMVQLLNLLFLRKVPTLFTVHNMMSLFALPSRFLCYVTFVAADHISFVSDSAFQFFSPFLRKMRKSTVQVVVNGVDLERVDFLVNSYEKLKQSNAGSLDSAVPTHSFELLNVGALVKAKNQFWLLRLLTQLPEHVTLTIIGEGELRSKLESLAVELRVSHRVRLTGLLPREDVYRELLDADLFVSSSFWEGLPVAVLEAMALRRPIIVSDIGPHREIANYGNSVKILPMQIDRWVEELKLFMQMDRLQFNVIGDKNREIVESNFTIDHMHEEYTQLYKSLARQSQQD